MSENRVKTTMIRCAGFVLTGLLAFGLMLAPEVSAQPTVTGSDCSGCHDNVLSFPNPAQRSSPDPTIDWGVIIGGTPTSGSPASITVNENSSFELDFIIREMTQVDGNKDVSLRMMLGLPATTWTVGTTSVVQNTGLTGWNANYEAIPWDSSAGIADFSTWFPNSTVAREADAAASSWTANGRAFYDDATANDLDGIAEKMGSDVLITVPAGIGSASPGTPYELRIVGIGHYTDNSGKAQKGHVSAVITVNVVSGGDSTPPTIGTVTPSNLDDGTYVDGTFDLTATVTEANVVTAANCEVCVSTDGTCDTEWTNVGAALGGAAPNYTCSWTGLGPYADAASLTLNIRATDDSANTGTGTPVTRTVDAAGPVQNVGTPLAAATGAAGEIDLTWGAATDAGVGLHATLPYRIRQLAGATAPNADCTSDGTEIFSGTALLVTDTGLTPSSQYSYRLCTYDAWGQLTTGGQTATATSGAAAVTPPDTAITAPTVSAVLSGASFNITGTATAGTNPLQDVLVSTDGGSTYPNTATGTGSWSWSWTLPSVDYTAYTIMAKARDNQGTPLEDPTPASVAIFVDNAAPTGLSLNAPADTATGVSTTPSLQVNAATDANPTVEYQFEVAEDSGFSVALQTSAWQAGTSWTPAALSAGTVHYWRATARDGAGNTTTATATRTFTTAAGCVPAQPTVSLAPGAQTIPNDGGLVVYTVTVTNNDSACADATFTLSVNDTDPSSAFYTSVLSSTSLTIASGAFDTATVTVQAIPGNDAVTNDTTVTATDSPTHDPPVVSAAVTTTVTLGGGCVGTGNNSNATAGGTMITGR